jgi:hypothetical protein
MVMVAKDLALKKLRRIDVFSPTFSHFSFAGDTLSGIRALPGEKR